MPVRLSRHVLRYSLGTVLVTLAGFVSFPILTRLFSVEAYGVMSLIGSVGTFLVAFGKAGLQHAVPRFHAEVRAGKRSLDLGRYAATVVGGMLASALVVMLIGGALLMVLPDGWLGPVDVQHLLLLTLLLVPIRVLDSALSNLLQAEQRSTLLSSYGVLRRYAVIACTLGALWLVSTSLEVFYVATLVAEAGAVLLLGRFALRGLRVSRAGFSPALYRDMLVYGAPMVAYELSGITLFLGDRFVIESLMGAAALGLYSAAYSLCGLASTVLVDSLQRAVSPTYMRLWEEQGAAATAAFVSRTLHFYLIGSAAVLAVCCALGGDLLALLASEKYRAGAAVVPWVMAGVLLGGTLPFFGAGLYLTKRTRALMWLLIAGAAINMALNLLLIPVFGLVGAGAATFSANLVMAAAAAWVGRDMLRVRVSLQVLLKLAGIGAAAYAAMVVASGLQERLLLDVLVQLGAGLAVFAALVCLTDGEGRRFAARLATQG